MKAEVPEAVAAYVAAFNAGDWAAMRGIFTADAQIWGVLGYGGLDAVEPIWRELHEGLAMRLEPVAAAVDGDTVVLRYRETGRFQGAFRGLAGHEPTGRTYEVTAMEWFELQEGRIARRWGARDSAAIERQLVG
ncbi:MAG TPA: nuclear transport factor 2 family protein [Allosphingosinicella sp.]|nr:nuclear transport factor 2 family protein [Allosphingosinicella sp.]